MLFNNFYDMIEVEGRAMGTPGRKSNADKTTEKSERIAVYFTKEQLERLNRYAKKKGEPQADSIVLRTIIFEYLDSIGFP